MPIIVGIMHEYARCCNASVDAAWNADLIHPSDYTFPQTVGARIHREGHPGVMIPSVRRAAGTNFAVFNSSVLSNPRLNCQLTYRLENNRIHVERQPDAVWLSLDVARFS